MKIYIYIYMYIYIYIYSLMTYHEAKIPTHFYAQRTHH